MLLYSSSGLGSVIILFAFKGEGWDATVKCEAIFSLHTEGAPVIIKIITMIKVKIVVAITAIVIILKGVEQYVA